MATKRQHFHVYVKDNGSDVWVYHMSVDNRDEATTEVQDGRRYYDRAIFRKGLSRRMSDVNSVMAAIPTNATR